MVGNKYPKPCERIWTVSYADSKKEYYELRTVYPEHESGYRSLWHGEYPLGQGITEFLYIDLNDLEAHIGQLKEILQDEDKKDAFLYDMTMWWLKQSPLFAPLAVAIQRIHLGGSVKALEKMLAYYREIQPKLKYIASDCFYIDEPEDMGFRYYERKGMDNSGNYLKLIYSELQYGVTLINSNFLLPFDKVEEYIFSEKAQEKNMADYYVTEMLHTENAEDMVHFLLSRYLMENVRFRACKYCGRYFGITGGATAEYCSRVMDSSRKTCKEMGSLRLYEKRIMENPAIKEYKRSYKAHNARIRHKLWTKEQFFEWSKEARQRRDECLAGKTSLEEFVAWLDSDRMN